MHENKSPPLPPLTLLQLCMGKMDLGSGLSRVSRCCNTHYISMPWNKWKDGEWTPHQLQIDPHPLNKKASGTEMTITEMSVGMSTLPL